jgi:hypothetical protein
VAIEELKLPLKATLWTITSDDPRVEPDTNDVSLRVWADGEAVYVEREGEPDRYLSLDLISLLRAVGISSEGG